MQIKHLRVLFLCLSSENGLFRHSVVSFLVSFYSLLPDTFPLAFDNVTGYTRT